MHKKSRRDVPRRLCELRLLAAAYAPLGSGDSPGASLSPPAVAPAATGSSIDTSLLSLGKIHGSAQLLGKSLRVFGWLVTIICCTGRTDAGLNDLGGDFTRQVEVGLFFVAERHHSHVANDCGLLTVANCRYRPALFDCVSRLAAGERDAFRQLPDLNL